MAVLKLRESLWAILSFFYTRENLDNFTLWMWQNMKIYSIIEIVCTYVFLSWVKKSCNYSQHTKHHGILFVSLMSQKVQLPWTCPHTDCRIWSAQSLVCTETQVRYCSERAANAVSAASASCSSSSRLRRPRARSLSWADWSVYQTDGVKAEGQESTRRERHA